MISVGIVGIASVSDVRTTCGSGWVDAGSADVPSASSGLGNSPTARAQIIRLSGEDLDKTI